MGDLHNYPKSICDGIEKSGIIKNDKQLKPVLLFNYIDKEEPRVEIFLYPVSKVCKRNCSLSTLTPGTFRAVPNIFSNFVLLSFNA